MNIPKINSRLLLSGASIAAAAALVVGATFAFFSDTETSQDNTFVAGSVDLKVDDEATYNGSPVPAATWAETDLTNEKFFNFDDIKPGDYGENTISLHVLDNDAWVCTTIDNMEDLENTCNSAENDVPDPSCGATNGEGELAENLNFFAWLDDGSTDGWQNSDQNPDNNDPQEGDNVWLADEELPLFSNEIGPASDVLNGVTYALADSQTGGGPFIGSTTNYIGLAWCAGTLTAPGDGTGNMIGNNNLNCDGSTLGNIVQTDSVVADISFYAEQSRNNPDFLCNQ